MAAYAALVSCMYIIEQLEHHPRPPITLDKEQVESLTEKLTFLQEFLEGYSSGVGYSREADDLESRIADAACAAEDIIESHIVDRILTRPTSHGEEISSNGLYQDLQKVIEDMGAIKKEVMEVQDQLQRSTMPAGSFRSTGQNDTMVGFDDVLIEVMDKLTGGQLDRQLIPIVGMGGIGKTTLARNIYQHQVVVQHFDILVWVTVSQEYRVREVLTHLLQEDMEGLRQVDECELGEKLHKRLSGRRYLILMDDVWDMAVWDKLRWFFPNNNNGSRILITTRISNFQLTDSYVLKMRFLDKDKSWSLFSKIVFGEEPCPLELKEIGKKIVENCKGLPLSIVVIGGLLAKSEHTREYWECITEDLNSIVNSEDDEICLKILHMSYNQLPVYLKPCFLYMGIFAEDKGVRVSTLVKLWVAEGFLKPISGKSLEMVANEYLEELINRNLILVHALGSTGNMKYCNIHDLLRDLCLREAQKERFYNVIRQPTLNLPQETGTSRRIVLPDGISRERALHALQFTSLARSLICDSAEVLPVHKFRLLRILSCLHLDYTYFLEDVFRLVNSRLLVLNARSGSIFHSSVYLLWNLHTLIVETGEETAPFEIWNMPWLRHLEFGGGLYLPDPPCGKVSGRDNIVLGNLQMLSRIINFRCCDEVVRRIPNIKKLEISYYDKFGEGCLNNLGHLHKLESFYCLSFPPASDILHNLTFPHSLKRLTIAGGTVHWEDMLEEIGSLPLLEKLILRFGSFKGREWETVEGQFPSLKFLEMELCRGLEYWTIESTHFSRLEHLVLDELEELKEIPSEIGEISALKSIKLVHCTNSVVISARKMLDEQLELYGEVSINVRVQTRGFEQKEELRSLASPNFQFL